MTKKWSKLSAEIRATPEYKRLVRRDAIAKRLTDWMHNVPVVAPVVRVFWYTMIAEGPVSTLTPRWGALTFSFLNDGYKPTWFHTWHNATHDDPYSGKFDPDHPDDNYCDLCMMYPTGAPSRRTEPKPIIEDDIDWLWGW